jgi:ABC-type transport system substrate-binding protein
MKSNISDSETLRVGVPTTWGALAPALQHTALADVLTGHTFEPLVRIRLGVIEPVAALSWSVSDDRMKYGFCIDTSKRFSNGEHLSAQHFKSAWEHALRLPAKASNSSLASVLYRVKGYADFAQTGNLEGVRVLSDSSLEVEFSGPYRSALDDLSFNRFAAAIYEGDKALGTGPYALKSESPECAEFQKNTYASEEGLFEKLFVSVVDANKADEALKRSQLDVYKYFGRGCYTESPESLVVKCLSMPDTGRRVLRVNGLKGRFFEAPERRRALQALVWKLLREPGSKLLTEDPRFRLDPQFYLPFQAGRLSDEQVAGLMEVPPESISQLLAASQAHPIYVISGRANLQILGALQAAGLTLDPRSGQVTDAKAREDYYKLHEADLDLSGFSVSKGDPDGAYHFLGRDGSVTSPMIQRPAVADLLEEGREILESEKLHAHYQKVSAAILTEVPFVHMGVVADQIAYRNDKVETGEALPTRSGKGFHLFRKK